MENKKVNPLTLQSKQWLLDALLHLMKEKAYGEITVKELTEQAGLDRKTFYRNFKTKEDILRLPMKAACDKYVAALKALSDLSSYNMTKAYFTICLEYIDFFKLLNQHTMLLFVLMQFEEYLPNLNEMFSGDPTYRKKPDYELAYQAGGFWNATVRWINNGLKETPDEIAHMIASIMPPSTISG